MAIDDMSPEEIESIHFDTPEAASKWLREQLSGRKFIELDGKFILTDDPK